MARGTLTKTTAKGPFGTYSAGSVDVTMTAADASNLNQFVASGNDLVIARNTGAVARTVTINSVADPYGRTGNITAYSLDAGDVGVFGPFRTEQGWRQNDGYIYLEASHAEVLFGIITL